jgi:transcriptional regulator with XRE-family HTH domain
MYTSASELIRDVRHQGGLTQGELARRAGVTQSAIAQLERPGANPSVARLETVLRAAGRRLSLGTEQVSGSVDETLLARNLRMTPAQRLAAFETARSELADLRRLMPDAG